MGTPTAGVLTLRRVRHASRSCGAFDLSEAHYGGRAAGCDGLHDREAGTHGEVMRSLWSKQYFSVLGRRRHAHVLAVQETSVHQGPESYVLRTCEFEPHWGRQYQVSPPRLTDSEWAGNEVYTAPAVRVKVSRFHPVWSGCGLNFPRWGESTWVAETQLVTPHQLTRNTYMSYVQAARAT